MLIAAMNDNLFTLDRTLAFRDGFRGTTNRKRTQKQREQHYKHAGDSFGGFETRHRIPASGWHFACLPISTFIRDIAAAGKVAKLICIRRFYLHFKFGGFEWDQRGMA